MRICLSLLVLGILVIGIPFNLRADAPELFKVLVSKGSVEIKGTGAWKPLPSGAKIFAGESIKVGDNALVSLVNSAGKSLEIKKSGTYQANDLTKQATSGGTLTKRFAGYVAAELTRSNDAANAKDTYKKNMTTTGGVERANDGVIQPVDRTLELAKIKQYQADEASSTPETFENLVALMPRPTDILDDNIHFSWQPKQGVDSFLLTIRDEKHEVLLSKTTARSHALVSAKALGLEPSKCYFWSVACMPDESAKTDEYSLCMITNSRKTNILDTVRMIETEAGGTSSVLGKLMLARYFEEESLFSSAFDVYREALALEPESDDVFVAFRRFRARLGLPE